MKLHTDKDIDKALKKLAKALRSWERSTAKKTTVIFTEGNKTITIENGKVCEQ